MYYQDAYMSASPEPGSLITALRNSVGDDRYETPVETLTEQRKTAQQKLDAYLSNLSDSPGARKVVEEFYREEHGKRIDTSEPDTLRREIRDIDSIIDGDALPVLSKQDLRDRYGVEGSWGVMEEDGTEKPHLAPEWVRNSEDEPYLMNSTGGTTGEPWERAMTRNDTAVVMSCCTRIADGILDRYGIEPEQFYIANPWPHPASKRFITESVRMMGINVREFEHEKLVGGGDEGKSEVDNLTKYLKEAEYSLIVYPIAYMFEGGLGVRLRRGNVDVDIVFNAGAPFPDERRKKLESSGYHVMDMYGETEYPELALERDIDGVHGYDLPFNAQINLVYDTESEELRYEGTGRFAYFPFGTEGQVIPGVYLSGVRGSIERVGDGHQILRDVERIVQEEECS
jgi:hypothetical protein